MNTNLTAVVHKNLGILLLSPPLYVFIVTNYIFIHCMSVNIV
jgi:hypothetical protein